MSLFLSMLLALSLSSVHGQSHTCASGGSLTESPIVKCEADESCDGCDITCEDCKLLNCGGVKSCLGATATITTDAYKFNLECNKKKSCKSADVTITGSGNKDIEYVKCNAELGCSQATIEIDCGGKHFKGVSCNEVDACRGATFIITDCVVEKVECDGNYGCYDATFEFEDSTLGDFSCSGGSSPCGGAFSCTGVDQCP